MGWRYVAERWFTLPNFFLVRAGADSGVGSEPVDLAPERAPRQPRPSLILTLGPDIPRLQRAGDQRLAEHYSTAYLLWDAAAPPSSQVFMLPGALL